MPTPAFQRCLFVGAHLDDIELAAGGTAARIAELGGEVHFLVLSDSAYTGLDGQVRRDRETAQREGIAAAGVLGVQRLDVRGWPSKDIDNESAVVEAIEAVLVDFRPTTIFTHWPFDTHKSHANTSLGTIAAARRHNSILLYEPIIPSGRSYIAFKPQAYVAIDEVIDKKLAALREHATEYQKYGEDWIQGVLARARYRGYEMGTRYGEAFEVLRWELQLDP